MVIENGCLICLWEDFGHMLLSLSLGVRGNPPATHSRWPFARSCDSGWRDSKGKTGETSTKVFRCSEKTTALKYVDENSYTYRAYSGEVGFNCWGSRSHLQLIRGAFYSMIWSEYDNRVSRFNRATPRGGLCRLIVTWGLRDVTQKKLRSFSPGHLPFAAKNEWWKEDGSLSRC